MKLIAGAKNLAFWWLRGGEPVSKDVAQGRAGVCLQCPFNESETRYEQLKGALAEAVKTALAVKHERMLCLVETTEEKLGVCRACGCELKLLVWSPDAVIEHKRKSDPAAWGKLWEKCWQRGVVK